jgi:hypothetical protein
LSTGPSATFTLGQILGISTLGEEAVQFLNCYQPAPEDWRGANRSHLNQTIKTSSAQSDCIGGSRAWKRQSLFLFGGRILLHFSSPKENSRFCAGWLVFG